MNDHMCEALERIRAEKPLVHNITNFVVMNFTANALLALGASPVMAHAVEEVEEMVSLAGALVLNIGTLSGPWVEAMHKAARAANLGRIPVILDPVGAGATRFRTATATDLLREAKISIIRGNASEVMALPGSPVKTRGVDSSHASEEAHAAAVELSRAYGCVVAVTGERDFITDGKRAAVVSNGHPLMGRITGTGCAASALTGAFAAVEADSFAAAVGSLVVFGVAGEMAAASQTRPGSFQVALLDSLDAVERGIITSRARLHVTSL